MNHLALILLIIGWYSVFCSEDTTFFSGIATYYHDSHVTQPACGFVWPGEETAYCAMNSFRLHQNGDSAIGCGTFVQVKYKQKEIICYVVDECPYPVKDSALGCWNKEHLDLSRYAFGQLDELKVGVIPIEWRVVFKNLSGSIKYKYHDNASQYWLALQVRNHSQAIRKLEIKKNNQWVSLKRSSYNYFIFDGDAGKSPYSFRVTSIIGETLEDGNIPFEKGKVYDGAHNFSITKILEMWKGSTTRSQTIAASMRMVQAGTLFSLGAHELTSLACLRIYDLQGRLLDRILPIPHLFIPGSQKMVIVQKVYQE